jgi:hypothetical protein
LSPMLILPKSSSTSGKKSLLGELVVTCPRVSSSRAQVLPNNLIAPHPYRSTRGRVSDAYCPVGMCTLKDGIRKTKAATEGSEKRRSHMCLVQARVCVHDYIVRFEKVVGCNPRMSRHSHDPEKLE